MATIVEVRGREILGSRGNPCAAYTAALMGCAFNSELSASGYSANIKLKN
jgi:enolase